MNSLSASPLILGIDPGSRKTGYGLVRVRGSHSDYVASGVIRTDVSEDLPARLKVIFDQVSCLIADHRPDEFAIESVFMSKSAGSALKLGQARGAAIVAAVNAERPVFEYEARKVKQSVVGTGAADKLQVQQMVVSLLRLSETPQEDAADALAVALCHAHSRRQLALAAGSGRFRRGRLLS